MGECEITVGIDARTLVFGGSSVRGIGVYVYEQVRHVALLKPHWRFVLYLEAETANQTIKKLLTIPNVGIAFYDHFSPSDVDLFYFPDVKRFQGIILIKLPEVYVCKHPALTFLDYSRAVCKLSLLTEIFITNFFQV